MNGIQVYIGVGSNVGDREGYVVMAREELGRLAGTRLVKFSPVYETEPVSPIPQGRYLNAAAELSTGLEPGAMFEALRGVERRAGRPEGAERVKWGPRTLDLDILLYGQEILSGDELVVPHPLMHERWYVLRPLADLNPGVVHPVLQMTVGELLKHVEQKGSKSRAP